MPETKGDLGKAPERMATVCGHSAPTDPLAILATELARALAAGEAETADHLHAAIGAILATTRKAGGSTPSIIDLAAVRAERERGRS